MPNYPTKRNPDKNCNKKISSNEEHEPILSETSVHLSEYGYSLKKKISERHKALINASEYYGDLHVLRRLNLVRNLSVGEHDDWKILSEDVKYLSDRYRENKKFSELAINEGEFDRQNDKSKNIKAKSKTTNKKSKKNLMINSDDDDDDDGDD
jgi:hypothetical protein